MNAAEWVCIFAAARSKEVIVNERGAMISRIEIVLEMGLLRSLKWKSWGLVA